MTREDEDDLIWMLEEFVTNGEAAIKEPIYKHQLEFVISVIVARSKRAIGLIKESQDEIISPEQEATNE